MEMTISVNGREVIIDDTTRSKKGDLSEDQNEEFKSFAQSHNKVEVGEPVKIFVSSDIKREPLSENEDEESSFVEASPVFKEFYSEFNAIKSEMDEIAMEEILGNDAQFDFWQDTCKPEIEVFKSSRDIMNFPQNIANEDITFPKTEECDATLGIRILKRSFDLNVSILQGKYAANALSPSRENHDDESLKSAFERLAQSLKNCDGNVWKSFAKPSQSHTEENHVRQPYSCPDCHFPFKTLRLFRSHKSEQTGEKPFRCEECCFRTAWKNSLACHLRLVHGKNGQYLCTYCDRRFIDEITLARHLKVHSEEEKRHVCNICGRSYAALHGLRHHEQKIHALKKKYACKICDFSFAKFEDFRQHKRIHNTDSPFECMNCGLKVTTKHLLAEHIQSYHRKNFRVENDNFGEKFACPICNHRFTRFGCLVTHQASHIGEKSFECKHCGLRTTSKKSLNRHIAEQHGE